MYICRFFVVSQINNNNCYTLCYCAKYGKFPDIYKQSGESFFCFAYASQTCASLSLRRLRVHETTRLRVADAGASLSLRRLLVYKTTRLQVADALGFAVASQTTSPQDYEWLPPWASLALRRRSSFELRAMSFEPASQTTSLQDNKPATAPLVVSLTRCLVVWRSNAKLNFRSSVVPTIALRQ